MTEVKHLTTAELEAGLDEVRQSPKDEGMLSLIVRRPSTGEREVLETGELNLVEVWPVIVGACEAARAPRTARPILTCNSTS